MPPCSGELGQHLGVVGGLDHHGDVGVVLGGGADHRRAADVDVLDAVVEGRAFGDGRLERIEVHHQEIDRLDAVLVHRRGVLLVAADRQQAAVHLRVQRLDAAVHHLGKAGELGDVEHLEPGVVERLGGAAGGDELDAVAGERLGEIDEAGLVGDRQQGAGDAARVAGHVLSLREGLAQEAGGSVCGIPRVLPGIHSDYSGNSGSSAFSGRVPGAGGVWRKLQRTAASLRAWP